MMEPLKAQTALNIRRHGKKGFKISGVATREEVASMIVGEFFVHSAIGRMKLGELWEAATVGMLYNAKIQHEDQAAKAT
jgi:hypothetical protein